MVTVAEKLNYLSKTTDERSPEQQIHRSCQTLRYNQNPFIYVIAILNLMHFYSFSLLTRKFINFSLFCIQVIDFVHLDKILTLHNYEQKITLGPRIDLYGRDKKMPATLTHTDI